MINPGLVVSLTLGITGVMLIIGFLVWVLDISGVDI